MSYNKTGDTPFHEGKFKSEACSAKNKKGRRDPFDIKFNHNINAFVNLDTLYHAS